MCVSHCRIYYGLYYNIVETYLPKSRLMSTQSACIDVDNRRARRRHRNSKKTTTKYSLRLLIVLIYYTYLPAPTSYYTKYNILY